MLHAFYLAREDIWLELSHTLTAHAAAFACGRLSVFAVYMSQLGLYEVMYLIALSLRVAQHIVERSMDDRIHLV